MPNYTGMLITGIILVATSFALMTRKSSNRLKAFLLVLPMFGAKIFTLPR
jgi:type II secretory pathway component PulF